MRLKLQSVHIFLNNLVESLKNLFVHYSYWQAKNLEVFSIEPSTAGVKEYLERLWTETAFYRPTVRPSFSW